MNTNFTQFFVDTDAGVAFFTLGEWVGEAADVAGGDPDARVFEHGGVEADVIFAELDFGAPEGFFDVV